VTVAILDANVTVTRKDVTCLPEQHEVSTVPLFVPSTLATNPNVTVTNSDGNVTVTRKDVTCLSDQHDVTTLPLFVPSTLATNQNVTVTNMDGNVTFTRKAMSTAQRKQMQRERDKQAQICAIGNESAASERSLLALLQKSDHAAHRAWLALGLRRGWVDNAQRDVLEVLVGKLVSK